MIDVTYDSDPPQLVPEPLSDEMFIAIARVIRVCAEIEDCLNFAICSFAQISETNMLVFLGKSPIRAKAEIAEKLATLRPDGALVAFKRCWTTQVEKLVKHRNVLAHGVYVGKAKSGAFAFLSSETHLAPRDNKTSMGQSVFTYTPQILTKAYDEAAAWIPEMERAWKIEALRGTHRTPNLQLHPKAQKSSTHGGRQPSRPQSSQE